MMVIFLDKEVSCYVFSLLKKYKIVVGDIING